MANGRTVTTMTDNELFGSSEELDCSDCVNHGGDWDCDHVQCRKGTDTISRRAAIDAFYEMASDTDHLCTVGDYVRVLETLSAQQWIPCKTALPDDDTEVIVSCTDDSGDYEFSYVTTGWHYKGLWVVNNERCYFVRAWQPLPESYKEEQP